MRRWVISGKQVNWPLMMLNMLDTEKQDHQNTRNYDIAGIPRQGNRGLLFTINFYTFKLYTLCNHSTPPIALCGSALKHINYILTYRCVNHYSEFEPFIIVCQLALFLSVVIIHMLDHTESEPNVSK